MFKEGDLTSRHLKVYDRLLRHRFYRVFIACKWVRDVFVNDMLFDRLVRAAGRNSDLKTLLLGAVLRTRDVSEIISFKMILRVLLAL